ncbi:MAG: S1/P1 nuclease [Pyrinomonadaceae bacterium]|nr:S1/P1 nuclease [Pyrinomonadaceae bacterium]MCX7639941.1 S1/P1 nuclease [Pyrinomonadaceae bacterium]MDW8304113.1 S1/P1 nuclease [Acidobacteriota bacterium]
MRKKALFLLILLKFFSSVFAWDDVGHKTTAYIAWQVMTPRAREKAIEILLSAPEDSHLSALFLSYDARPLEVRRLEFFMLASIWADLVRDRNFPIRHQKYHQGSWHYVNKFWKAENGKVEFLENPEGEDAGKAVEKLFEFERILKDSSVKEAEKAIALAWFLHVAGDIHQPLHNSARVTEQEPKGDRGGNLFLLTPKDTPREKQENLHWYWDSIIVRNIKRGSSCDIEFIRKLSNRLMKKYPLQQLSLEIGKYDRWHEEGVKIATEQVYPSTLKRFEMPSAEYKKKAFEISERQLVLAGYRIGMTLNQIFQ